jgi:uncharacterized membrane protein YdjX (TVP38/TMEM64 family)
LVLGARYAKQPANFSLTQIKTITSNSGWAGPLIFMAIAGLAIILFLPLTSLNLIAGILFSLAGGIIYVTLASTLSATILFYLARFLGQPFVEDILPKKMPALHKYQEKIRSNELFTVFLCRFMPIFPFSAFSLILGLTKISFRHYLVGTVIGALPWTFIYVYFGHSLLEPNALDLTISSCLILIGLGFYFYSQKKFNQKNRNK